MFDISPDLYYTVYYFFVSILCIVYAFGRIATPGAIINENNNKNIIVFALVITLGLWLGNRDVNSNAFGDTHLYALLYEYSVSNPVNTHETEFGWKYLMFIFRSAGFSASAFFTFVAILYFSLNVIALQRIFKNNLWPAFLIFLISFSTLAFCVNGVRNGLATAITAFGISYVIKNKKWDIIIGFIIMLLAATIHKTVILPAICVFAAVFIKNFRWCLCIWIGALILSLLAGNYFAYIFASLGFDDRMTTYMNLGIKYATMGYNVGFRYDFLLYSLAPVVLGYIAIIKRGYRDNVYLLLINTYILANAFWVLVIRAAFSNRFAYLSWFLYPIVLAYPLLKAQIWHNQSKKVGLILIGYVILNNWI